MTEASTTANDVKICTAQPNSQYKKYVIFNRMDRRTTLYGGGNSTT